MVVPVDEPDVDVGGGARLRDRSRQKGCHLLSFGRGRQIAGQDHQGVGGVAVSASSLMRQRRLQRRGDVVSEGGQGSFDAPVDRRTRRVHRCDPAVVAPRCRHRRYADHRFVVVADEQILLDSVDDSIESVLVVDPPMADHREVAPVGHLDDNAAAGGDRRSVGRRDLDEGAGIGRAGQFRGHALHPLEIDDRVERRPVWDLYRGSPAHDVTAMGCPTGHALRMDGSGPMTEHLGDSCVVTHAGATEEGKVGLQVGARGDLGVVVAVAGDLQGPAAGQAAPVGGQHGDGLDRASRTAHHLVESLSHVELEKLFAHAATDLGVAGDVGRGRGQREHLRHAEPIAVAGQPGGVEPGPVEQLDHGGFAAGAPNVRDGGGDIEATHFVLFEGVDSHERIIGIRRGLVRQACSLIPSSTLEVDDEGEGGRPMPDAYEVEHLDVLIVGAGISGIGAAHHLQERFPERRFAIFEAQAGFGGTWRTHRYPGVRSDSDLFTFGYHFKPWKGAPIATGDEILRYLADVIEENNLDRHIRYQHRIVSAGWSSDEQLWRVEAVRGDTEQKVELTANFLWMCQGYYRHDQAYTPEWPGMDRYDGRIVHPQHWPDDLDLSGKRVVVIGSGATAATLIPAIAETADHVTMLQRSPTFFLVRPNSNELADTLRSLDIPDEWTHEIVRRKIVKDHDALARVSFDEPELLRQYLIDTIRPLLPEGFDVDKHFNPNYRPWQQRIAVLPDGDLFKAVRDGKAGVTTDQIVSFTEKGIALESGDELIADVIITATGFDLCVLGDIDFSIDGEALSLADSVTYRGIMFTGVPNLAWVFGYFRSSWTLRADLISDFVCRLFARMDELQAGAVVPRLLPEEADMDLGPWIDPENFNPGYLNRSMHLMPRQGTHEPWQMLHDYTIERDVLARADLSDARLEYIPKA